MVSINVNSMPEKGGLWIFDMKPIVKIPTILLLILGVSYSYVFAGLAISEVPLMKESTLTFLLGVGLVGFGKLGRIRERINSYKPLRAIKLPD
jgi:hypothetical protein